LAVAGETIRGNEGAMFGIAGGNLGKRRSEPAPPVR
jgi:hypothetical protein